jgi:hypothetical protein
MRTGTKILFIHHSTGANLIHQGKVRELLKATNSGVELWDHSYNLYELFPRLFALFTYHTGLSDKDGSYTGIDYKITLSNNSPKEYAEIFSRHPTDPTLQAILKYNIIAFKNCFPTTRIESDAQLEELKGLYTKIHNTLTQYTENIFVLITPPPLRKELTTSANAARAKDLVNWLVNEIPSVNLKVFDLFTLLADENGYLKPEYTKFLKTDSHPNRKANVEIAPLFVKHLNHLL